jgi:hypothetical protein
VTETSIRRCSISLPTADGGASVPMLCFSASVRD